MPWWIYALIAAGGASATGLLSKVGVEGVPSNLAAGTRTLVAFVFIAAIVVFTVDYDQAKAVSTKSWAFLGLAGVATGISWLAYFKAFKMATVIQVAPIDKLSLPLTVVLAAVLLGESLTVKSGLGVSLMVAGAFLVGMK